MHVGNYLGAIQNWVALQDKYQAIFALVDYHALTIDLPVDELRVNSFNLAVDLLAVGIDPQTAILFRQSDLPEHTELAWILTCLIPVPELERMTQYKDLVREHKKIANAGMLMYPVLMAADVMLYKAEYVPVGEDQMQHLELARIITRKFNTRFGDFFPEIKPILAEDIRIMSLTNPMKKMSKSLGPKSYISLRDTADDVRKKISKAVTDTMDANHTLGGGHNLLILYKHFGPKKQYDAYRRAHEMKKLSYAELKNNLAERIIAFLKPIQEKQAYYESHGNEIEKILADGARRARAIATKNLHEIKRLVGLG